MGYLLYREVRDQAPADWTPTERLVAWVIADDANDASRKSWIKLPEIMARTGIKTESGVRQALQRLAARGFEFRVPIKTGKDGRLVFAAKGHSLDYLVPLMPDRQLSSVAFDVVGQDEPAANETQEPGAKATVTDAKGDCAQSPLSSTPHLKDQKKAPRRARTSGAGDLTDAQTILDDVRQAAHKVYGDDGGNLADEDCMRIYRRFCCDKDGTPRKLNHGVYAYLVGGPFKDVPTIDEALKPPQRRDSIPFGVQLRYDDPETTDEERTEIVEDLIDGFGPGEEPAVEAMIMRNESLGYIVRTLTSGQMHRAA